MKYLISLIFLSFLSNLSYSQLPENSFAKRMNKKGVAEFISVKKSKANSNISPSVAKSLAPVIKTLNKKPDYYLINGLGFSKTEAAIQLVGSRLNKDVLIIDSGKFKDTYIGETEKNLSRLFKEAESRGWILFFDEADALFGKRTNVKDSHDRYANQEVSYLFKKIQQKQVIAFVRVKNPNQKIRKAFGTHILSFGDNK